MGKTLNEMLADATCYECRWQIMFTHIAAGYDLLKEQYPANLIPPEGFEQLMDRTMNKGIPSSAYMAGRREFSKLSLQASILKLNEEIDNATQRMRKDEYHRLCGDEPIQVLGEIKLQIPNISQEKTDKSSSALTRDDFFNLHRFLDY